MAYEFAGTTRTIHMDTVGDSPSPTWMGWSRGRWEGETLVVDMHRLQRSDMVRQSGELPQRRVACRRALYSGQSVSPHVRSHHRRPEGVYAAVEDADAPLPALRAGQADPGIQVRRSSSKQLMYGTPRRHRSRDRTREQLRERVDDDTIVIVAALACMAATSVIAALACGTCHSAELRGRRRHVGATALDAASHGVGRSRSAGRLEIRSGDSARAAGQFEGREFLTDEEVAQTAARPKKNRRRNGSPAPKASAVGPPPRRRITDSRERVQQLLAGPRTAAEGLQADLADRGSARRKDSLHPGREESGSTHGSPLRSRTRSSPTWIPIPANAA